MVFEGRYGNNIRIGSRASHPLIFIANGRNVGIPYENFYDNSIFGMTTVGGLRHHYGNFQLASDGVEDNVAVISKGNATPTDATSGYIGEMTIDLNGDMYLCTNTSS